MIENFKEEKIELKFSKEIYSKEILLEVCYILLDDYFFHLDLIDENFIVNIFPKGDDFNKEEILGIFLDELIETSAHKQQAKDTLKLREILLEKALLPFTQTSEIDEELEKFGDK